MSQKKKNQQKQQSLAQSVDALKLNGMKAFRQKDFEKAIATWGRIPAKVRPADLLAEAHFRRGLAFFYGSDSQAGLNDLQTATSYQPADVLYAFHLGLAKHHQGDIAGAQAAYQIAQQFAGSVAVRAAYPLVLALLQNGQDPATASVWDVLTSTEQTMLRAASVFRRRPYTLPPESSLLWRALSAFDAGDLAQAQAGLEQVLANGSEAEKSLAHLYQGNLAALTENWDGARHAWESAYMARLRSPRLSANLAEIYQRRAEELLLQGDAQTALTAANEAKRHQPDQNNTLDELLAQIHQHLGYQAATANRWDEAQTHWKTAVALDSASFRLAYNLALAYEKAENYALAGQTWREALRRRPRRADHPDALSDDAVARLWQRTAECYRKADEFDEVGHIYQQAVKWAPDNLNLRLALAESLLDDGRLQAATNELERILERDPKHIPALLRIGEVYFRNEDSYRDTKARAKKYWEQALELDPKNPQVRLALAEWYLDRADIDYSWDKYAKAAESYQKALEFRPNHIESMVYLAECFFELDQTAKGDELARQALLQAKDFDDFAMIADRWVCIGDDERARQVADQAEARLGKVNTKFYVGNARHALKHERKEEALRWLQRAAEKAAPEDAILVEIGELLMDVDTRLAREYLQKALDAGQRIGQAHLFMGILEARDDNPRASKKHFAEAERIARRTKDDDLAESIEMARIMGTGPKDLMHNLMNLGGPSLLEKFMQDFGTDFDKDWDDD